MKRNLLTMITGAVLLLIFGLLLFVFQVRKSEMAVVTTFNKPTRECTEPGAYLKLPWPIQKVHILDQRTQNFEDRFEQVLTPDGYSLLVSVYAGWRITEPAKFFPRFSGGSVADARRSLEDLVRSAKNEVVGKHPFSQFVSTNEKELKFAEIEQEILTKVQQQLKANNYGMQIEFLGIKKLGLPENVTQAVFDRMKSERGILVSEIENLGREQASNIRSTAEADAAKTVSDAQAAATRIRGEAEAAAQQHLAVFQKNPEFAIFLSKIDTLEQMLKEKSTLILDQNTPPLDLLNVTKDQTAPGTTTPASVPQISEKK